MDFFYCIKIVRHCFIESSGIDMSEAEVQLVDITGRKVQISSEFNENRVKVDMVGLKNGIYQIIILVNNDVYSKKVFVNKY